MIPKHGGILSETSDSLDFSANINPLGMPDSVRNAIIQSADQWTQYPDPVCTKLTQGLAQTYNISADNIICGNGAADLIFRIVHALKPKRALICTPTFSEYESALDEVECKIARFRLSEQDDFNVGIEILRSLTMETDICFLCSPNNPTGRRIAPDVLKKVADYCNTNAITLVCDESFLGFTENAAAYSLRNVLHETGIILSAFTKLFAIPGIRLGYICCGSKQIASRIRSSGQYWSVSVPAQAAGLAALQETAFVAQTVWYVAEERGFLTESLRKCGIKVYRADANFLLIKAQDSFADEMYKRGIYVRRCENFIGLTKQHFRLAVRTHSENLRLIRAAEEVYAI